MEHVNLAPRINIKTLLGFVKIAIVHAVDVLTQVQIHVVRALFHEF